MSRISRFLSAGLLVLYSGCYKPVFEGSLQSGDVKLEESVFWGDYRMRIDGKGFSFEFYDRGKDGVVDEFVVHNCNPGLWNCFDFRMPEAQRLYDKSLEEITSAGVCNMTCPVQKSRND